MCGVSVQGIRLEEAKRINKSIAALGNCVAALARGAGKKKSKGKKKLTHVPFRDSKLTRLLTDSLGGNTKTCLCANVGPALEHYDETYGRMARGWGNGVAVWHSQAARAGSPPCCSHPAPCLCTRTP